MRIDAKTLGAYGGIAIVFLLIGLFVHKCPLDGNPVGFHINGKILLDTRSFSVSSCTSKTCTLTFDVRTNEAAAAAASPCPASSNCFHFKDDGTDTLQVKVKDKDPERTYPDFVDGTVEVKQ
jgi:hypothetical protein